MRLLDLFAGIGGFSLAAHWMGWETVAFVERDKFCQKVLRKNFGADIEIHDDITTFSGKPFRGRVDIVTGGFPCQPFSQAGKQKGKDDERHLFPEMLRVVAEARPRWVVAENVRGLLSIADGDVFEEVAASLEGEGYKVQTFCVPASAINAPHRRDRLWIVAHDALLGRGTRWTRRPDPATSRERKQALQDAENTVGSRSGLGAAAKLGCDRNERNAGPRDAVRLYQQSSFTDASKSRLLSGTQVGICCEEKGSRPRNAKSERHGVVNPDTINAGLQGNELGQASGERTGPPRSVAERFENENWYEAAARFCRVDDVVPNRVDRLKSLGNAIVPLLIYEIFKAIEVAENQ